MSYGSGGRRRRSGAARVFSIVMHVIVIGLVTAGVVLLVQGARTAFGMAASILQPQGSSAGTGSSVSTGTDDVSDPVLSGSVSGSAAQSGEVPPPDEPDVPVVVEKKGIVVIDPGHGGGDPGCGPIGALEKDIVLSISEILKEMLENQNVTVVMTRETDKGVSLTDRTVIANDADADLFVSIHCNAFEGKASGLECYYHEDPVGKQMAVDVTAAAAANGIKTREIRSQDYQVLRGTQMPAVLVEVGFLTDEAERTLLLTEEYQEKLASSMLEAVMKALETVKEPLA